MASELLKTIFKQNRVYFRSIDLHSSDNNLADEISKHSQINCSVLANGSELFIALNPATHKFNLSRLNKVVGKKLSFLEQKEKEQLNINLSEGATHIPDNNIHVFIDESLEYQDELYIVDEKTKNAYVVDIRQIGRAHV